MEPALMDTLCELAELECEAVAIESLDDRLALLANGTVDAVLATLSYTPDRAEQV